MNQYLSRAAAALSLAQDLTEDHPQQYSEKTWALIADALALISHIEEVAEHEEAFGPVVLDSGSYHD